MIGKIITSVVITIMILFAILFVIGNLGAMSHKFTGNETFATFEDAQQFQTELVNEAERVEASVESFDLSIMSPPKVFYQVYMPTPEEFKYGERLLSVVSVSIAQILFTFAFLAACVLLNIDIWRSAPNQDE